MPRPPPSVSGYLRAAGWAPVDAGDAWARWRLVVDGRELILTVPLRGQAPDYPRRFQELVDDLRRLEQRTAEQIVRDIRPSGSDVLRIRIPPRSCPSLLRGVVTAPAGAGPRPNSSSTTLG